MKEWKGERMEILGLLYGLQHIVGLGVTKNMDTFVQATVTFTSR